MQKLLFILIYLFFSIGMKSQVTSNWLSSKILNDSIEILQYTHEKADSNTSTIYVLDGRKMLNNGFIDKVSALERGNHIPKFQYIFVSTLTGKNRAEDKRNQYFFCNPAYLKFFEKELIPFIEPKGRSRKRYLLGVSFGGLCGAYFSTETDAFVGYALLSPITYPCTDLMNKMAFSSITNLTFFISTGTNDAESYSEPLAESLKTQGHQVEYLQTSGGHDFSNWMGQLDKVLNYFEP